MEKGEELFVFRKFMTDEDGAEVDACFRGAMDKLQTLYPGRNVVAYDARTIGIGTDSLYSETGMDTYELGMVDGEIPAMRNTRDGEVITFRV